MKVLLVLGTSAGGVGKHVQGLARLLSGAGHDVVVAGPPAVADTLDLPGLVAVVPVPVGARPHPVHDARALATLSAVARGADVVHAHGLRAGALAVLAAARGGVPVVVTVHNAPPTGRGLAAVYAGLERIVARGSALVLGVSADLVTRMEHLGARGTGFAVVPAPAPRLPTADRYAVHAELGIDARTRLGVVVGRLAPQKGLDGLLDAHAELTDLDLLTVVAGEGPLRARLQRRIDVEGLPVRLLGRRDDVPDLLTAADVVVSSALWEGQPVWLQEALHAGAAIVATDVGGTGAVLGDAGILVPPGDPVSLSRAVRDVVTHGGVRDDLRSKAVERSGELPTDADALAAAEGAYATVLGLL
ncbi:glycosyltransferase family 4 protein [Phycicoccus flavus]|uniref:Glycosyltransferase family 4 protein n=1 Tax=Phycicoccus flavus TaxID=2502783 RepID=A0A8T6R2D0_9MICO|nr:glycosyltransferase family 4 protein [Phycicoccus flavus]NHA67793.1 glycosyltransferase family 4 protein [Phycicoccus flavus]